MSPKRSRILITYLTEIELVISIFGKPHLVCLLSWECKLEGSLAKHPQVEHLGIWVVL